ncbi:UvrD-helicase domain-containing protein [Xanthomonas arboricola]|uniref:UvrD-helicase domain-containing protein n=1 Tax=Xanthomonas arboricola TaxID=56448 RepID=UPI00160BBE39|nr:UvrD-helicase domain-containing protein [Xanthomonas arboricola]MBB4598921.1 hypothetical protein [Xanthomonas arboricola]
MNRGIVIAQDVVELLSWSISAQDCWINDYSIGEHCEGIVQTEHGEILYIFSQNSKPASKLLVISSEGGVSFSTLPIKERGECFQRIVKIALSRFSVGRVKAPVDWRLFHSGSLLSFQSNRFSSPVRARVYMDFSPEETEHAYAFSLVDDDKMPLSRVGYDQDLFLEAVLGFADVVAKHVPTALKQDGGQISVALSGEFSVNALMQGVPYSVWVQSKLTSEQRLFFDAPFEGPLRLRGAAGTGKTLVLCLRFIKEIYNRLDNGVPFRAVFITHGQETADLVRLYLNQMDERGVLPELHAQSSVDVTTLHAVANEFINFDADGVMPLSLDGVDGRKLQMELMSSIWKEISSDYAPVFLGGREESSIIPKTDDPRERAGFLCDVIDEFSSVLESFGVRDLDHISDRYLKQTATYRGIAKSYNDKTLVLEFYKRFRRILSEMGVVSLDQFISDFLAYLNSFRWDAVRPRRGYDFVFADEIHLFNKQERQVFAYLMKSPTIAVRVALAYDPRQSPRSMFLAETFSSKGSIWIDAKLSSGGTKFELFDVFRYTKEILDFLRALNQKFPADDLSEELGLTFGESMKGSGNFPTARNFESKVKMAKWASDEALRTLRRGEGRTAVLCLDQDSFWEYTKAGLFSEFAVITSRDEVGAVQKYIKRPVLSTPELVAGLQFDNVILLDANSTLVSKLGSGANGLQKFISLVYLAASRASISLSVCAHAEEGGFAVPINDSIQKGVLVEAH